MQAKPKAAGAQGARSGTADGAPGAPIDGGSAAGPPLSGPLKRSVMIAGHSTSISLEPIFWDALKRAAAEERLPLNALVARIDSERIGVPEPPGLASAIRMWLFKREIEKHSQ